VFELPSTKIHLDTWCALRCARVGGSYFVPRGIPPPLAVSRARVMARLDETPLSSVVVNLSDVGVDGLDPRRGSGATPRDDTTRGTRDGKTNGDGTVPRLWHTLTSPDAVRRRAAAFAFSSKGLPQKYDYRDWTATTFMLRDRALGNFIRPWVLCVAISTIWAALYMSVDHLRHPRYDLSEFERMYSLIFTALGFMLVFRMSRAAIRFWDCRTAWGTIAMCGRCLVDDVIVNIGQTHATDCDEVIRWYCAFVVGTKCHLRVTRLPAEQLTGIISEDTVDAINAKMESRFHLYCSNKMRTAIKNALLLNDEGKKTRGTPSSRFFHPQHSATLMHSTRSQIDALVYQAGAMERIKATRLPIVYVAHLRTFLLIYVMSLPFVYVSFWGWGVIPATAAVAFALLGIEGAATECENPFSAKRTNHLGMEGFCENSIADIAAMLEWWREEQDKQN